MLRNRLILTLLLDDGIFVNSHQFNIQRVANIETVAQYLNFDAIDELVLVNVGRSSRDISEFSSHLREVTKCCFVPVSAGGGVRSVEDAKILFSCGADKVVVNTSAFNNSALVPQLKNIYGRQSIVASIDVKRNIQGLYQVYTHNGTVNTGLDVLSWAQQVEAMGAGEIYLTSIDQDGVGRGYDLELLEYVSNAVGIPVIASGGVGHGRDLVNGVLLGGVQAVSMANHFHFTGYHGLNNARRSLDILDSDRADSFWHFY